MAPSVGSETTATREKAVVRQRRTHRKSRLGCGNCKLRGVKCDEAKPACKRCTASAFTCDYAQSAPALQLAHSGAFQLRLGSGWGSGSLPYWVSRSPDRSFSPSPSRELPPPVPLRRIPVAQPVTGRRGEYELRAHDYETLSRFHKRTVWAIGTVGMRAIYAANAHKLIEAEPYLHHVLLAITLIHDAHLTGAATSAQTRQALAFHWYQGTVLFKQNLLQKNLSSSERDAVWASAALLGASALAHLDTLDPLKAWPLKPDEPTDFDWLKLCVGKHAVWKIADPLRPDSIFHGLLGDMMKDTVPDVNAPIGPGDLPEPFYSLLNITPDSTPDTNPYHGAASVLAQLLPYQLSDNNILRFLTFINQPSEQYQRLLSEKNPRAMLLLAWWYAKAAEYDLWWVMRRSRVEGWAICIWLRRHCADDERIMELLEFPMSIFRKVDVGGLGRQDEKRETDENDPPFMWA